MVMINSIAVVIPMYNCSNTILEVIKCIEKQTFKDYISTIIAVDDGSTDTTLSIVNEYKNDCSVNIEIVTKINGGVSSARNLGMKVALERFPNIQWFCFCDSDDLWNDNKLELQVNIINANADIDCLGSQYNEVKLKINNKVVSSLVKGDVKSICVHNYPQPSTVMMNKDIFINLGGFDETQKYAEDGNYFMRVAHNYNLYYLPECLINYGFGKRAFGVSGLSGNLKGMYLGNVKNLKDMKQLGYISSFFYMEMRVYHYLKYLRRRIISKR